MALTKAQFLKWLKKRRRAGETLESIGRDFGVGRMSVHFWLNGGPGPSGAVLTLAEMLWKQRKDD